MQNKMGNFPTRILDRFYSRAIREAPTATLEFTLRFEVSRIPHPVHRKAPARRAGCGFFFTTPTIMRKVGNVAISLTKMDAYLLPPVALITLDSATMRHDRCFVLYPDVG